MVYFFSLFFFSFVVYLFVEFEYAIIGVFIVSPSSVDEFVAAFIDV